MQADFEHSHFNGLLKIFTLPIFRESNFEPVAKRLLFQQGELTMLSPLCPVIRQLSFLSIPKNEVRGNHYHKEKIEFLYVLRGKVNVYAKDLSTGGSARLSVGVGQVINIHPPIAHALQSVDDCDLIEFSPTENLSTDMIKSKII